MSTDLGTEEALRAMAARTVAPAPSSDQWHRILARRQSGDQVPFPSAMPRLRSRTPWIWLAAAAAVALLLSPLALRRPVHRAATLAPGLLVAQRSPTPAFPVLERLDGPRLKPGRWSFAAEPLGTGPFDTTFVYQVEPATRKGTEAWLVLAGMRVRDEPIQFSDSTWLSRDRLDPLAHWTDTTNLWKPVIGNAIALLQSVTLDSTWRASIPLLGNRTKVNDADVPWVNLAVYGEEEVNTPAGRFRCWKVGFRPSLGFFFWMRPDGTPVRQGMARTDDFAFGRMNLALVKVEPL